MPRVAQRRARACMPTLRALLWSAAAGLLFVVLNSIMRGLSLRAGPLPDPVPALPDGAGRDAAAGGAQRPGAPTGRSNMGGQFTRGGVHTIGLCLWFIGHRRTSRLPTPPRSASPGPIFIMLGAVLVFKEPMRWERWLAAAHRLRRRADRGGAQAHGQRRHLHPGDAGVVAGVRRVVPDHQGAHALRARRGDRAVAGDHRRRCSACRWRCCTGRRRPWRSGSCSCCAACSAARATTA